MGYKCVYMLSEIKEYLKNTVLFAFDFETSPRDNWGCPSAKNLYR